nr:hypothetical protein [Tanacetum cinerariifolium]
MSLACSYFLLEPGINLKEMKDVEPADEGKCDEEMTDIEKANDEHEESIKMLKMLKSRMNIFLNLNNLSFVEKRIISMLYVQVQQSTPLPIPTTSTTKAPTSTSINPESKTLFLFNIEYLTWKRKSKNSNKLISLQHVVHQLDLKFHLRLLNILDQVWEMLFRRSYRITLKNLDKNALRKKQALFDSMYESKSINKHLANKTRYHALIESLIANEDAMDQGDANLVKHKKRPHDDVDRDQDPPAGPDQGLKKRKSSKDAEPPKNLKSTGSSKYTTRSQPKSTSKSIQSKETVFKAVDTKIPLNQGDDINWKKLKGNRCPCDLSKPVPLQESQGRLTVHVDFFFNNDLEYLSRIRTDRKYTTLITKAKATKYDVEGIEDMVPNLWSPIKEIVEEGLSYYLVDKRVGEDM